MVVVPKRKKKATRELRPSNGEAGAFQAGTGKGNTIKERETE